MSETVNRNEMIRRGDAIDAMVSRVEEIGGPGWRWRKNDLGAALAKVPRAIPKYHGRLIDVDRLLRENPELADCDFTHPKYDTTLRELMDSAPTVVPAEGKAPEILKCEKCGNPMPGIEVNFFDREGDDHYKCLAYEEHESDAVVIDVTPNWTGHELDEAELPDTIRCMYCGEFPFENTEVQTYDFVRLVMFKGGKPSSRIPVEGGDTL